MSKTTMIVHCEYSGTGQTLEKLVQSSFYTFLKKELSELAICREVQYACGDEWPLISGGIACT